MMRSVLRPTPGRITATQQGGLMSFTALEFVVLSLALWELLEIWNHGELFATKRAALEVREDFRARLLRCMFCLAPWTGWGLLPAWNWFEVLDKAHKVWPCSWWQQHRPLLYDLDQLGSHLIWMLLIGLALARTANVLNDLTYRFCRTPGHVRD